MRTGVLLSGMMRSGGGDAYRGAPIAFDDKWLSIDDYYVCGRDMPPKPCAV